MPGRACRCTASGSMLVARDRMPGAGRRGPAPLTAVEISTHGTRRRQARFVRFWLFYHRQLEDIAAEKDTLEMYVHRDKDTSKAERRRFKASGAALPVLTFLVALTRG